MFNLSLLFIPSVIGNVRNALGTTSRKLSSRFPAITLAPPLLHPGSFRVPMFIFAGINLVGTGVVLALFFFDRRERNILNLTAKEIVLLSGEETTKDDAPPFPNETTHLIPT